MYGDWVWNDYLTQNAGLRFVPFLVAHFVGSHRRFPDGYFGLEGAALRLLHGNQRNRQECRFPVVNGNIRNVKRVESRSLCQHMVAYEGIAGKIRVLRITFIDGFQRDRWSFPVFVRRQYIETVSPEIKDPDLDAA